jgi:hypothetical protein
MTVKDYDNVFLHGVYLDLVADHLHVKAQNGKSRGSHGELGIREMKFVDEFTTLVSTDEKLPVPSLEMYVALSGA